MGRGEPHCPSHLNCRSVLALPNILTVSKINTNTVQLLLKKEKEKVDDRPTGN